MANGEVSAREAFLVLYALFWTLELSSVVRFRAFETHLWWHEERQRRWQARWRFFVAIVLMNLAPLLLLVFLYLWIVPADASGAWGFIVAGLAALSVFGFHRILFAVTLSPAWRPLFYESAEAKEILQQWRARREDRVEHAAAHLLPGLCYLALFPALAFAVRLFTNASTSPGIWSASLGFAAFFEGVHVDSNWFVAIFTGALVWVGLYQWRAIRPQGYATERSAQAARDSANAVVASERPYIVIKNFQMLDDRRHMVDGLFDLTVRFELWNYGPTPAWPEVALVHARAHHMAQLEGEPLPDFTHSLPGLLGGVIVPNEGVPYEFSYPDHTQLRVTPEEWQLVEQGQLNLFFYGVIQYHDGRSEPHHTTFGIRYAKKHPPGYWNIMNPNYWQHS